jgi:hypothetical protein
MASSFSLRAIDHEYAMTYVESQTNDLCSRGRSITVNDTPRVLVWMKEAIGDEKYIQGEVGGRDHKHDGCQYRHHGGCECPLSPKPMVKIHEL